MPPRAQKRAHPNESDAIPILKSSVGKEFPLDSQPLGIEFVSIV